MFNNVRRKPQFTPVHLLRALGYAAVGVWAVLFMLKPSSLYLDLLGAPTLYFWLSVVVLGATGATLGVVTRIDLKLEFPGLLVTQLAPIFFLVCQIYFLAHPELDTTLLQRQSSVVYAAIPGILLLPRTYELFVEVDRYRLKERGLK